MHVIEDHVIEDQSSKIRSSKRSTWAPDGTPLLRTRYKLHAAGEDRRVWYAPNLGEYVVVIRRHVYVIEGR